MKPHISVCICTYRRNQMLERLIRKTAVQETAGLFDFSIVVVDNDPSGHARETVARLRGELGLDITYGIEPERTIPAARNHALHLAKGDYIAIIDDDEFPPPHWLITLYRAIQTFDVDGALGPVHPFFEAEPPKWLIKGRFCERPTYRTGTLLRWDQTRTGNVLLKKEVFDRNNLCFDKRFRTGGSDQQFFREAMGKGCRFVAVEEAAVYEIVSPERWQVSYYLKRALVNGFNHSKYEHRAGRGKKFVFLSKALLGTVFYVAALPVCLGLGMHRFVKCIEKGGHHFSRLMATGGFELIRKRNF